jgi:hypothetical protein
MSNYGSVAGGDAFFAARLHAFDWTYASQADRLKALVQATELIDQFDYIGQKYTVQVYMDANTDPCADGYDDGLAEAELAQPLQFPRGSSTTIPSEIERATYLIAQRLLSGRDPEADLESLVLKSAGYGDARSQYDRSGNTQEHMTHLIPSPQAWNLIKPFLRARNQFTIKRV